MCAIREKLRLFQQVFGDGSIQYQVCFQDIGLYRDGGPANFKNKSGPESEKIKKSIKSIFRENELKITIQCNLKIVDYLDATFNLTDSSYRQFNKTNNEISYMHKQSNHPPSIIKQLPSSVESYLIPSSNKNNLIYLSLN